MPKMHKKKNESLVKKLKGITEINNVWYTLFKKIVSIYFIFN